MIASDLRLVRRDGNRFATHCRGHSRDHRGGRPVALPAHRPRKPSWRAPRRPVRRSRTSSRRRRRAAISKRFNAEYQRRRVEAQAAGRQVHELQRGSYALARGAGCSGEREAGRRHTGGSVRWRELLIVRGIGGRYGSSRRLSASWRFCASLRRAAAHPPKRLPSSGRRNFGATTCI